MASTNQQVVASLLFFIMVFTGIAAAGTTGLIDLGTDNGQFTNQVLDNINGELQDIEDNQGSLVDKKTFNDEGFAQQSSLSSVDSDTSKYIDLLLESRTMFGEKGVATRNLEIDLVSNQGTSVLRDIKSTNGSASIPKRPNESTGELQLNTGTTSNSVATLDSANLGRYSPGQSAQMGIGFRELEEPENGQYWQLGYFDGEDGFTFGHNSTCLYVAQYSNGDIDKSVCRSNWNGENINDSLGRGWTPRDGAIYQIDYSWYGYGAIRFSLVETKNISEANTEQVQNTIPVHVFTPEGDTSINDPIQPLRVEVGNGDTNEDYEGRLGGRQYSVFGDQSKVSRITNDGVTQETISSSDYQCLIAFTKDTGNINEATDVKYLGLQSATTSSLTQFAVFYNANLTSQGTYDNLQNTPSTETSLLSNDNCQFDSSNGENIGYAQPNGTELWNQLVLSNTDRSESPGQTQINGLNAKLPDQRNIVLAARSVDGTSTDVSANVRFTERK